MKGNEETRLFEFTHRAPLYQITVTNSDICRACLLKCSQITVCQFTQTVKCENDKWDVSAGTKWFLKASVHLHDDADQRRNGGWERRKQGLSEISFVH